MSLQEDIDYIRSGAEDLSHIALQLEVMASRADSKRRELTDIGDAILSHFGDINSLTRQKVSVGLLETDQAILQAEESLAQGAIRLALVANTLRGLVDLLES